MVLEEGAISYERGTPIKLSDEKQASSTGVSTFIHEDNASEEAGGGGQCNK